jgi:hypothetical protein
MQCPQSHRLCCLILDDIHSTRGRIRACDHAEGESRGRQASEVVGSIIRFTSETRFAGKPPCFACSRTNASFGAI